MQINLVKDHWYYVINNEIEYQKIKLIFDYYDMSKYLPDMLKNKENLIYNGYQYLGIMNVNSGNFNSHFKQNFIEVSLDYILNYNVPKEAV